MNFLQIIYVYLGQVQEQIMRFLKIFLVSFFSLIGTVAIIMGIMYLAGSFKQDIVEPENIYFGQQQTDFFVDDDFTMTINSSTEGVTEKKVTLSLLAQDGEARDGYITDGKIKIPEVVQIGKPFLVELVLAPNAELGSNIKWAVGGISQIFATSESDKPIGISCKVHIDVPVYSLELKTYTNDNAQTVQTSFALGESFFAEAVFKPAASKYKFGSTTEMKKVYFDTSFNNSGYIEENSSMVEEMVAGGIKNINGYTVLKTTNSSVQTVGIKARVFQSATLEDKYTGMNLSDESIVEYLQNETYGAIAQSVLTFTNRTISSITLANNNTTHTLGFNKVTPVYANNQAAGAVSLGIKINASDDSLVQGKLADVGLRALVKQGNEYREATSDEIIFADNMTSDFAVNENGQGLYYKNLEGEFVLISSLVGTRYSKDAGDVYSESITGAYEHTLDGYALISDRLGSTYDKYYMSKTIASNIDNSYWNVISVKDNLTIYFEVKLFENNDIVQTNQTTLQTYNTLTTWKTGQVIDTKLTWKNEDVKNLVFVDSDKVSDKVYPEFALHDNLEIENPNATYTTVKFLAYSNDPQVNVNTILSNITATDKYDLSAYNINGYIYEINGNILRAAAAGEVMVLAVIVKTDHENNIIEKDGKYQIYAVSTPQSTTSLNTFSALEFNIEKTIQNLSAEILIHDKATVKNIPGDASESMAKLSFLQNQDVLPIFKLNFVVTTDGLVDLEDEVSLFVDAWNNGEIGIEALNTAGVKTDVLYFKLSEIIDENSGTFESNCWKMSVDVCSLEVTNDIDLTLRLTYKQTDKLSQTKYVSSYVFANGQDIANPINIGDRAVIEIYDGYAMNAGFAVETTESQKLQETLSLTKGTQLGQNSYVASDVDIEYLLADVDVTSQVLNDDGSFKTIFYDKFGNIIALDNNDFIMTESEGNLGLTLINYSSILNQAPTATLYIEKNTSGQLSLVEYNTNKDKAGIEDGVALANYVDITSEYLASSTKTIQIDRYGASGTEIELGGENGLIKAVFTETKAGVQTNYHLYDILEYSHLTQNWQSTYAGYLSFEDGKIKVNKTIGTQISLNFSANSNLGYVFYIELRILPNIDATYEITTLQEGANNYVENNTYQGIYSDNDVQITVSLKMTLKENFTLSIKSATNSGFLFQTGAQFPVANVMEETAVLTVRFGATELGKQVVSIVSSDGAYDFKRDIFLFVHPNLCLVDAEQNTIDKNVVISALDQGETILTADDYSRIVGDSAIQQNSISLKIANEYDGERETPQVFMLGTDNSKTLTGNIFILSGFTIAATEKLLGNYFVIVDVMYGENTIGQLYVTINTNITYNSQAANFEEMFTNYNDEKYLVLLSNQTYTFEAIKSLFSNVDTISFEPPSIQNVYSIVAVPTDSIEVTNISKIHIAYCLKLSNDEVGYVYFPVLFSPLEKAVVQYDASKDAEKYEIVNNDLSYLQNVDNYLIKNNIYDKIDSGKSTSIINKNYSISLDDDVYTYKTYSTEKTYLLAKVAGKYYVHEVLSIQDYNRTYKFTLLTTEIDGADNVLTDWNEVSNSVNIANDFSEINGFVGVFSSANKFTLETLIKSDKGYGIDEKLYNNDIYRFRVVEEIEGKVDFVSAGTTANTVYNTQTGLIVANAATEDKIVWVVITKNDNFVAGYRLLILANSSLNVYYPYSTEPINQNSVLSGEEGEYINFNGESAISINFAENISSKMPVSVLGSDLKRIIFQYGNEEIGFTNAINSQVVITPHSISVNESAFSTSQIAFAQYFTFSNNVLTIFNTNDILVINLRAQVFVNSENIGAEVMYKIFVNFQTVNYALYLLDDNQTLTDTKYVETEKTIAYGESYNFSKVALVNVTGSSHSIVSGLEYHFYSEDGKDLSEYLRFDSLSKTLSVKDDIALVSDLKVHFLYYSSLGKLLEVELTFKSNIDKEFNTDQTVVTEENGKYYIYSDVEFSIDNIFSIINVTSAIESALWICSFDAGQTYQLAQNILFTQDKAGEYEIFVKVCLSSLASGEYLDDYNFSFILVVQESVLANFSGSNILQLGEFEFPTLEGGLLEFSDMFYNIANSASDSHLFTAHADSIIKSYTLKIDVIRGADFVASVTDIWNDATLANDSKISAYFRSPNENVEIVFQVSLIKDNVTLVSKFSLNLVPDIYVEVNYPKANDKHNPTSEAYVLEGSKINGLNTNGAIDSGFMSSFAEFNFEAHPFMSSTLARISFVDSQGNDIIKGTSSYPSNRVNIVVSRIDNNLIIANERDGIDTLNTDIDLNYGAALSNTFKLFWVSTTEILTDAKGSIEFEIYVDKIKRATYQLDLYANINSIFSASFAPINQISQFTGNSTDFETFFVSGTAAGNVFTHKQASIEFSPKLAYLSNLASTQEAWKFYVNSVSAENLVGEISINASMTSVKLALASVGQDITLENLVVVIGDENFVFSTTLVNSIYRTYVDQESGVNLSYRVTIQYLGEELSYENLLEYIRFDANTAYDYSLNTTDALAINTPTYVALKIDNQEFAKYPYTLKYDFFIPDEMLYLEYTKEVDQDDEILSGLNEFEITRLDGSAFTKDYFIKNNVSLYATVILETDADYPTTKSTDSIKYVNPNYISLIDPNLENIGLNTTYIDYLNTSNKEDTSTGIIYDFAIKVNGAENNGNYVYILIRYGVTGSDLYTYGIVKFFITSIWQAGFYIDANKAANEENTPLVINYDTITSNKITAITLSAESSEYNLINIYKSTDGINYAVKSSFSYTLVGEIATYLQLTGNAGTGNVYSSLVGITNSTNTAKYGDKFGYIEIKDAYGYVAYYYICLRAQQEDSLTYSGQTIGATNNSLYEGSTISVKDASYTSTGDESIDYIFKINNLSKLPATITYDFHYFMDDLDLIDSQDEYGNWKIPVQKASFYAGSTNNQKAVTIKILISLYDVSDNYSEYVVININANLLQRYTVSSGQSSYVREGQYFAINDYINVNDKTVDGNIGEIKVSGTMLTFVTNNNLAGASVTIGVASGYTDTSNAIIKVGTHANGESKAATNGKYYHPLREYSRLKNLIFENYKFQIKSVLIPNDSGFVLMKQTANQLTNGTVVQSSTGTQLFFNSETSGSVALVYRATNGNYYFKTFAHSTSMISITETNVVGNWTQTTAVAPSIAVGEIAIFKADLSARITDKAIYDESNFEFVVDKMVSVVTLDNASAETISVNLNNGSRSIAIPYALNYDGEQSKSLYEEILTIKGSDASLWHQDIHKYEKASEVISSEDMKKLKGVEIYNDTLTLAVLAGYQGTDITVQVTKKNTEITKQKTFRVANNNPHYVYISLYSILGEEYGLEIDAVYDIEVTYTLVIEDESEVAQKTLAIVPQYDELPTVNSIVNDGGASVTVTYYVESFEIELMDEQNGAFVDKLDILTSSEFTNKIKANVQKAYLARFVKDGVVYSLNVNYNVTPKYYSIDDSLITSSGTTYNVISLSELESLGGNIYKIPYTSWAGDYKLVDYNGKAIANLSEVAEDMYYEIQVSDGQSTSSGSATLNVQDNSIQTTENFDPEQHYIKVAVYTYVHGDKTQKVYIGDVLIKLDLSIVSVSAPGTYNIKIDSPDIGGLFYTINVPYTFSTTTEKVSNILENENVMGLVKENEETAQVELGFYTGNGYNYQPYLDCKFSVVTVISQILSTTFLDDEIVIKLALNESQSSVNQRIKMEAVAVPLNSATVTKTSAPFFLTVGIDSQENYFLTYQINEETGAETSIITKGADGYYTIHLPLSPISIQTRDNIFSEIFVGANYSYKINILQTKSVALDGNLGIVYAENVSDVEIDNTMFFQISYQTEESTTSQIVAVKNSQENQKFYGPNGFALDIRSVVDISQIELKNCTVAFLCDYNMPYCIDGGQDYSLLLSYNQTAQSKVYSIAKIAEYSDTSVFAVDDYAMTFLKFKYGDNARIEEYGHDLVETKTLNERGEETKIYMPSSIVVTTEADNDKDFYLCYAGGDSLSYRLVAYKPQNSVVVHTCNYEKEILNSAYVELANVTEYFSQNVSTLIGNQTELVQNWQSSIGNETVLFTETTITKSTQNENIEVNGVDVEIIKYDFSAVPCAYNVSFGKTVATTDNVSLSEIIFGTEQKDYYFSVTTLSINSDDETETSRHGIININANSSTTVNCSQLVEALALSGHFGFALSKNDMTGAISTAGLFKFEIRNVQNLPVSIKAVEFSQITGTTYFITNNSELLNYGEKASLITSNTYQYSMPVSSVTTYYVFKNTQTGEASYHITCGTITTATAEIDLSNLTNNQVIEFTFNVDNLHIEDAHSPLYLHVQSKDLTQNYTVSYGGIHKNVQVPYSQSMVAINLYELFDGQFEELIITVAKRA